MAYDVKLYKAKRPVASPDDISPDNIDNMGSGNALKQQLAPVIPEFIWRRTYFLGSHDWEGASYWRDGHQFVISFWSEPANPAVWFSVHGRETPGRRDLVQRICDALGWVAVVDCWEPPHPRDRSLVLPRAPIDSAAHPR